MTREHRSIVSLSEIRAVRWTCRNCQMATSFVLDRPVRFPEMCQCGAQGIDSANAAHQTYEFFVNALQAIAATEGSENASLAPADLHLEFVIGGGA